MTGFVIMAHVKDLNAWDLLRIGSSGEAPVFTEHKDAVKKQKSFNMTLSLM